MQGVLALIMCNGFSFSVWSLRLNGRGAFLFRILPSDGTLNRPADRRGWFTGKQAYGN